MTRPHLSPAVLVDATLYLSGQLAFDSDGRFPHDDIARQTEQVMKKISSVLSQTGFTLDDVVKTTVWLRDASDFLGFNEAYAEAFGDHRPARSTVISPLVMPQARIEIEAIAIRR